MNRDEQIIRPPEQAPFRWHDGGIIAPQDQGAGGTWIAMRKDGIWACLLNGYAPCDQQNHLRHNLRSRGEIIPHILQDQHPDLLGSGLILTDYRSFRLWVGQFGGAIKEYFWDTEHLTTLSRASHPFAFISSSSWQQQHVCEKRRKAFEVYCNTELQFSEYGIPMIHLDAPIGQEAESIFMQRSYAETKSITQIILEPLGEKPLMRYWLRDQTHKPALEIGF